MPGVKARVEDPRRRVRGLGMRPLSGGGVKRRLRPPRSENLERVVESVGSIEVTSLQGGQEPIVDIGEIEEDQGEGEQGRSPPSPHNAALAGKLQILCTNHNGGSLLVYQVARPGCS